VKIILSLILLLALSPDAYAQFRGYAVGNHLRFRAAAPPSIPPLAATDADLARAERDAPVPDPFVVDLERRFGVTDDGLQVFGSKQLRGQGSVSASFDGHVASLHVRW